jgi:hypothetical protein
MARAVRESGDGPPHGWPWEQEAARAGHHRKWIGGAWPLGVATSVLLAAGYAWLGFVMDGPAGALVGCATGLVLSGLLFLVVESVISPGGVRRGAGDRRVRNFPRGKGN